MDQVTLVIGIIVFFLVLGLILRIVGYAIKIASIVLLLSCFLFFVGSYINLQAFIIDSQHQAFIVHSQTGDFIVEQQFDTYQYDPNATAVFATQKVPIPQITNITSASLRDYDEYDALKQFANSHTFGGSDTVWFVDASQSAVCTAANIQALPSRISTACLPLTTRLSWTLLTNNEARELTLHKIPLKSSLWQWLVHKFFG